MRSQRQSFQKKICTVVGLGCLNLFVLFGTGIFVTPLEVPQHANITGNMERSRSRPQEDLPPKILTSSHLQSLRDLLSEDKMTVRLGLRLFLMGPAENLDPRVLLFENKEAGILNAGGKAGLFTMQIRKIKKVTSDT